MTPNLYLKGQLEYQKIQIHLEIILSGLLHAPITITVALQYSTIAAAAIV